MNAVSGSSGGWKSRVSLFLAAHTVSLLGSSLVQYAIVRHIALSGSMMTISTVCGFFPQIAVSPFAVLAVRSAGTGTGIRRSMR